MNEPPDLFAVQFRISEEVLFQEISGEAVLLHLGRERYFGLNEIGTRAWQLLVEHANLSHVLTGLLEEYEVDEARLARDLEDLARRLLDARLIEVLPSEPG